MAAGSGRPRPPSTWTERRKLQVREAIERRWADPDILCPLTVRVLQRICALTSDWGKDSYDGSIDVVVNGRPGDGEWKLPALGIGRSKVKQAMGVLKDRGLIGTESLPFNSGLKITLNADFLLAPWETVALPPTIRTPKRIARGVVASRPGGGRDVTRGWSPDDQGSVAGRPAIEHGYSSQVSFTSNLHEMPSLRSGDDWSFEDEESKENHSPDQAEAKPQGIEKSAAEKIAETLAASAQRRVSQLEEARTRLSGAVHGVKPQRRAGGLTILPDGCFRTTDARVVWEHAWAEAFPSAPAAPAWGGREAKQIQMCFGRWGITADGSKPNGEWADFLEWTVAHWATLTTKHFQWMAKGGQPPPTHPSVGFLLRWHNEIETAWMERARLRLLSTGEMSLFETLRHQGLTEQEALTNMAETKVARLLRTERARLAAKEQSLDQARVRERTRPVQPVATDRGLAPRAASPTRDAPAARRPRDFSAAESALYGARNEDSE